jgi:trans-aconitate methyltransferase
MPLRAEIQKEYDALFRKKPNKWDNPERSNFMIKILDCYLPNPKEVIDVGCGNGVTLENYRRHNKTAKLYGIDPSQVGIELAQKRVPDGIFTTEEAFEEIKQFDLFFFNFYFIFFCPFNKIVILSLNHKIV